MPRLLTSLVRRAHHIDPLLPLLLRPCRDLPSARNELRWLREHVRSTSPATAKSPHGSAPASHHTLHKLCAERARGTPLQYLLGSQPFGDLDILCRRGALIPRPETETYTTLLASALIQHAQAAPLPALRILDLCTGTGCIALLLHALLAPHVPDLSILGVDISPPALTLARANLAWNVKHGRLRARAQDQVRFARGDVLAGSLPANGACDILVANPPYISPASFAAHTERSVRNYEPKLALVPPSPRGGRERPSCGVLDVAGDTFYKPLGRLARKGQAKIMVLEVAGTEQAMRVVEGIVEEADEYWDGCEVWHDDWHGRRREEGSPERANAAGGSGVRHLGAGHGRAVVCWRGEGREWLHGVQRRLAPSTRV
ncbi:hypothetical protein MMC18_005913 [Xylographa bjoerkii]|nr:hypothetical protein [Xylographa bjoerkii]